MIACAAWARPPRRVRRGLDRGVAGPGTAAFGSRRARPGGGRLCRRGHALRGTRRRPDLRRDECREGRDACRSVQNCARLWGTLETAGSRDSGRAENPEMDGDGDVAATRRGKSRRAQAASPALNHVSAPRPNRPRRSLRERARENSPSWQVPGTCRQRDENESAMLMLIP